MSNTTEVLSNSADELKDKMMTELIELLREDEFKRDLVRAINKDVNIPMLNEKTERKVFDDLYDLKVKETIKVLKKKFRNYKSYHLLDLKHSRVRCNLIAQFPKLKNY